METLAYLQFRERQESTQPHSKPPAEASPPPPTVSTPVAPLPHEHLVMPVMF